MKKVFALLFSLPLCASERSEMTTSTTTATTAATTVAAAVLLSETQIGVFNSLLLEGMQVDAAHQVASEWHPPMQYPHYLPARLRANSADKKR